MAKILKQGLKNLIAIPILGAQSSLASAVTGPASRAILDAGISAQAAALAGDNVKLAKKKVKFLK